MLVDIREWIPWLCSAEVSCIKVEQNPLSAVSAFDSRREGPNIMILPLVPKAWTHSSCTSWDRGWFSCCCCWVWIPSMSFFYKPVHCFLSLYKTSYLSAASMRSSTAGWCNVRSLILPILSLLVTGFTNYYIRRDHSHFQVPCLLSVSCASQFWFLLPILEGPHLFSCSHWKMFHSLDDFCCFSLDFFFSSTLFFLKQKEQTVPSCQGAGKPSIAAVVQRSKIDVLFLILPFLPFPGRLLLFLLQISQTVSAPWH